MCVSACVDAWPARGWLRDNKQVAYMRSADGKPVLKPPSSHINKNVPRNFIKSSG